MIGSAGNALLALLLYHRSKDPHAWKIPARRAEYSLTENVASPFQAEPEQCDKYMLDILRKKFHSPEWTRRLLSTGSALLVDGNLHHDNHWGICDCLSVADSSSCRSAPNSPPK
jgi:hypothetical protein